MKGAVVVDGKKLFLNPFITTLVGNVIHGVALSLKSPQGAHYEFTLRGQDLTMRVDDQPVPLDLGHAQQIVGNILHGILKSLKGAEGQEFTFISEA
jgi:hypothetical protein